ncbi:MAG: Transcription factor spt8 [Bathelium mastoideum]|nr:MAG: Transcription factor spt8 [Bathelium mastoideum]
MVSFDEEEQDGAVSGDESSHNDVDEAMDDVDQDADGDQEGDGDGDADGDVDGDDDENEDEDDEDDQEKSQDSSSRRQSQNGAYPSAHLPNGRRVSGDESALDTSMQRTYSNAFLDMVDRPRPRPETVTAAMYDIVPTIAAPQATSINALAVTADMRWVFSAGSDGFVRRFNWPDTVNSKSMLTVAQRHPYVDSVVKHGVLMSYWAPQESEGQNASYRQTSPVDGLNISPIQSLAVHHQGLWILAGVESGAISLHMLRHSESERVATLASHSSAVSVLTLSSDERSVLSGSWDKSVLDWDLNTGQISRQYGDGGGQISAIEFRPESSLPVPPLSWAPPTATDTFSSNNSTRTAVGNEVTTNGEVERRDSEALPNGVPDATGSPTNSLFNGSNNSLFGDGGEGGPVSAPAPDDAPDPAVGDEYDNEFTQFMANGIREPNGDNAATTNGDVDMGDPSPPDHPADPNNLTNGVSAPDHPVPADDSAHQLHQPNGIAPEDPSSPPPAPPTSDALATSTNWPPPTSTPTGGPVQQPSITTNTAATFFPPPSSSTAVAGAGASTDPPPRSATTFVDTAMDGVVRIWDRRQRAPVAIVAPRWTPPWCMGACWSPDGDALYVGRRNNTVDEFSLRAGWRAPSRVFRFPAGSGSVSAIRPMPNGRHLLCASHDILRLYDLRAEEQSKRSTVPFTIVPGHRTGVISTLHVDPTCRFILSAGGTRGWEGGSTDVLLGYEVGKGAFAHLYVLRLFELAPL